MTQVDQSAVELFRRGAYAEAESLAKQKLQENERNADGMEAMCYLALRAARPDQAIEPLQLVAMSSPRRIDLWLKVIDALDDFRRPEGAFTVANFALNAQPASALLHSRLGYLHLSLGDVAAAAQCFRSALEHDDTLADAWRALAILNQPGPEGDVKHSVTKILAQNPEPREAAILHHALAALVSPDDDPETHWTHIEAANSAARQTVSYHLDVAKAFEATAEAFNNERLNAVTPPPAGDYTPIFIVGMPRSGTTLLEQMLAASPEVFVGDELRYLDRAVVPRMAALTQGNYPADWDKVGASGLASAAEELNLRLKLLAQDKTVVTDKTPTNFQHIGLIHSLFPQAKIIHIKRDPLDTCLSIYSHPFPDQSAYSCDLEAMASMYAAYEKLMAHWDEALPGYVHHLSYEGLVDDPETTMREIVAHCGLTWSDEFLEPQNRAGPVRTLSVQQVRRPLYKDSVGSARRLGDRLRPMIDALTAAGVKINS